MKTNRFRHVIALLALVLLMGFASHATAKTDIMVEVQDDEWGDFDNPATFP